MLFFLQIKAAEIEGLNEPLSPRRLGKSFPLTGTAFAAGAVSLFLPPFIHPKNVSRETIERGCDKIR